MLSVAYRAPLRPVRDETLDDPDVILSIGIGAQLRTWRIAVRGGRREMGKVLGVSVLEAQAIEEGRARVSEQDAARLCILYGIKGGVREDFLAAVRSAGAARELWHPDQIDPNSFDPYSSAMRSAELIRMFAPEVLPPQLQTPDYALAVARFRCVDRKVVNRQIQLAEEQNDALLGQPRGRLWVVLGAEALSRTIAGPSVLRRQLDHLLERAAAPAVALQMVTAGDSLPITNGPFTIMHFGARGGAEVVRLPQLTGSLYLENRADVEAFLLAWSWLVVAAQTPAQTADRIAEIRVDPA